ncbi:EscI/YscI/HrpB family type III secretion system inner rod protein [Vibrio pectenicida]|uniref:EscI/YscI/HrpB family type III secretion system inner rod protein n=1 Tax=Vibrio pectenicida TaxID=62763 RepID=A0A7Y3ZZ19_9VIBR|nr:type III secretion system inner rod subunit SctI [Vibrio pectenicida]NOH71592.1 EscI/YscI/HrpB family type III secretion system inner rod protein [Vibrio pectenicida]
MEISAIARATSAALEKQTEPVNPDKGLVDKFSQLMQQGTQETSKLSELVGSSQMTGSSVGISPEQVIESQKLVTRALVEVDLAAKTAGSLSQSINKLVTMQ